MYLTYLARWSSRAFICFSSTSALGSGSSGHTGLLGLVSRSSTSRYRLGQRTSSS